MKRILIWALGSVLLWGMGVAGLIVFGTSKPAPAAVAITGPFSAIDDRDLPEFAPLSSARRGATVFPKIRCRRAASRRLDPWLSR